MNITEDQARGVSDLRERWAGEQVLKHDTLSTIERGFFLGAFGRVEAILRRIDQVPLWTRPAALAFLKREISALRMVGPLGVTPRLLEAGDDYLVRSWCPGLPLNLARPYGDATWMRSARTALRRIHRAGIVHNDLAKQQNWLVAPDRTARLTDFQLAVTFRRRTRLFRLMAREDLRHLLKHKRTFVPELLTAAEKRLLERKSIPSRIWLATGKPVYRLVTRRILRTRDREGGGPRLEFDAPHIADRLRAHPLVRDACVVPFPRRRSEVGLYAFVEAGGPLSNAELLEYLGVDRTKVRPPELIQYVSALPRDPSGEPHSEILQLIAMNQLDSIDNLVSADERRTIQPIIAERLNITDPFST